MGATCCVAARDRTITNGSSSDIMLRNVQYSPSWSFRWDNRGRVAGEEMSMNRFSDGVGTNDRLENKSQTTVVPANTSEEGSPLESFRKLTSHEFSHSEGSIGGQSDPSNSKIPPQVKELREIPVAFEPSPTTPSVSSFSASPLSSSRGHLRWPRRSPGHHPLRQVSDSRIPSTKSRNFSISEEESSDGLSLPAFADLMAHTNRERWSFDSESNGFSGDKISRSNGRISSSHSTDMRTCGACSKLLSEKSSWGSQKMIATNELAVIAILMCGHVYHAECLENMTPEINKYDPACPVCTFGEKQTLKLHEKALRAEINMKAKISKKKHKSNGYDDRDPSMKSSNGKPFLKRHFSFGSKGSRSLSEKNSSGKKGFFRSKSVKE